jgi:hypothetical protein
MIEEQRAKEIDWGAEIVEKNKNKIYKERN